MTTGETVVIRTGTANLASVLAALGRLGAAARTSNDPSIVEQGERVILPGVGAFGAAMDRLRNDRLVEPLRRRIDSGRPTLAICVGMQLLFEASDESPGCEGLGALPGTLRRFPCDVRTPQMGWNRIAAADGCRILTSGHVYFANSYRVTEVPAGWPAAIADHGGRFVAGIERGAVVACQFHPELSGKLGLDLLGRWLSKGTNAC